MTPQQASLQAEHLAETPKKPHFGFIYSKLILYADPGKRGLTGSEKGVLLAIADYMGKKDHSWPGYASIAHLAGVSKKTVKRNVERLLGRKILVLIEDPKDIKDSKHYTIDRTLLISLINKKKYKSRLPKLLFRLENAEQMNARTVDTVGIHRGQDDHTVGSGRPHPMVRTTPEPGKKRAPSCSENKPTSPEMQRERSLNGRGKESAHQGYKTSESRYKTDAATAVEFMKNEEAIEILGQVEAELYSKPNNFNNNSILNKEVVAARLGRLFKDWKEELGRYPDSWMIVEILESKLFIGLKELNWGTLTSTNPVANGTPFRERLFKGVVEVYRQFKRCYKSSNTLSSDEEPEIGADW